MITDREMLTRLYNAVSAVHLQKADDDSDLWDVYFDALRATSDYLDPRAAALTSSSEKAP